jgi:FAD/FMN-containing dehydrogenase
MTVDPEGISRRTLLRTVGAAGVAAVFGGCKGSTKAASPRTSTTKPVATVPTSTAPPTLDALSGKLSQPLLMPGSTGYAAAAQLYNPRFDATARPAAIARCVSAADIAKCVRFASAGGAPVRLRAGGHSYGGWSTGPGLVIDVSAMSQIQVDIAAQTALVGAGARLVDVYAALAAKGVAIAAGSCPSVGLTGLTLGGGIGVLTRAFGLTCDSLRSAEVVTADGAVREVDGTHDSDLYWALRGGGGGSFGVVTALKLTLRPAPTVHTFYLRWEFQHAAAVLTAWQRWISGADPQLWSTCKLLAEPGLRTLRATVSGAWIGVESALPALLAPLVTGVGAAAATEQRTTLGYGQAMLLEAGCSGQSPETCLAQALAPAKRQPFAASSAILPAPLLADGVTAAVAVVQAGMSVPAMVEGGISFDALGGAVAAVAPGDTAFPHRNALAILQYTATWASTSAPGGADPGPFDAFVRGERAALHQWTGDAAYVNYPDAAIDGYGTAYWGANYPRLQTVKRQYDPGQLFSFPQSVTT